MPDFRLLLTWSRQTCMSFLELQGTSMSLLPQLLRGFSFFSFSLFFNFSWQKRRHGSKASFNTMRCAPLLPTVVVFTVACSRVFHCCLQSCFSPFYPASLSPALLMEGGGVHADIAIPNSLIPILRRFRTGSKTSSVEHNVSRQKNMRFGDLIFASDASTGRRIALGSGAFGQVCSSSASLASSLGS